MENCIVVMPYTETSRLFNASVTKSEESFIGENGIVYFQHQAKLFNAKDACNAAVSSGNTQAFVRQIN